MIEFSALPISAPLQQRLAQANFVTTTPVQEAAIPPALEGRDVLATAQTGTGKTLSFLIPILEQLAKTPSTTANALVLLPTRELAIQVEQACLQLTKLPIALVVGGMAEEPQLKNIRRGARVIVATPGRLEDFLTRKLVKLDSIRILVLDEVDRMLDMGFQPAIRRIAAAVPVARQTLCYSATLEGAVRQVAATYLKNPVRVEIGSVLRPPENIKLQTFEVTSERKMPLLEHLLRSEEGKFLVFVRTKHGAERLAKKLSHAGWKATSIHGDRSQSQRNAALRGFAQGLHRILVATDVAARGIHVEHIAHVVNYDLPKIAEDFVHRVGRTGRASHSGVASTFTVPEEKNELRKIERTLKIAMQRFRVKGAIAAA